MNDVTLWAEPNTAILFQNCNSGRGKKIPHLLSHLWGVRGNWRQELKYVTCSTLNLHHVPEGELRL